VSVPIAYITIIVIWSTTPLGIKWSGEGVGYEFGVAARMLVGLGLLLALIAIRNISFPWDKHARRVYLVGGLSLFFAMASVYWAAQYIPSGWISVLFGISPIMTGILAIYILKEQSFSEGRLIGMLIGLAGLSVIFLEGIELRGAAWLGVMAVLFSTIAQPTGAVLLKQLKPAMPAISITAGSLVVSTPLFILNWIWFGPTLPTSVDDRTIQAILYLAVVGTGIGFPLYYYVLKHLSAGHVSLITLITPITALLLGSYFNGEFISARVWAGTGLIMLGLFVHEQRKLSRIWASR